MSQSRTAWSWVLGTAVSAVLLYLALRGVDWRQVWRTIASANWTLLAAAGGFAVLSLFLRSVRWRILLNAEGHLGLLEVFCATTAGYLGNNFLPARAGELVRTFVISARSPLRKMYVLTTALSERMMDVIALVLASSVVLLRMPSRPEWMQNLSRTTGAAALTGAVLVAVLPHTGMLYEKVLPRIPIPHRLRPPLLDITGQVLSDAVGTIAGARGLDLHLSLPVAMLLLTGLGLGSALPSTPGYVGVYQFVAVSVLLPFGFTKDAALAYILVFQALNYAVLIAVGIPSLYWIRAATPAGERGLKQLLSVKRPA